VENNENPDDILDVAMSSSAMSRVTYNRKTGHCTIELNGKPVVYTKIPEDIVESLVSAPSAGAYFNSKIRGKYE
jgi:hypothetical protein